MKDISNSWLCGRTTERSGKPLPVPRLVRNCSVARTLDILSDAWSFLVLREFYMGARRFDQIQMVLGVPRSTLSDRLAKLSEAQIVRRAPRKGGQFEYHLTDRGLDLYLVMLALMRFGDDHLAGKAPLPLRLHHRRCGHVFRPETVCSECREPITARQVCYHDGPGAGLSPAPDIPQRRRSSKGSNFERNRPSSVSRTVAILADRWSFLILRECLFGISRYDQFRERLGIAPNILADRLSRLIATDILKRLEYQNNPPRFEYRLTSTGLDLYLPLIQMLRWGDRWLGHAPPLILTHKQCGKTFYPLLVCSHCREPIDARDVRYVLSYSPLAGSLSPAQIEPDSN